MRIYLIIISVFTASLSCSIENKQDEIEYVKIFLMGFTDSVTDYNKGIAVSSYLHYNFKTDSAIYRIPVDTDSDGFEIFAGKINNRKYVDTLVNAINFLKKYAEGRIPSVFDSTDVSYDGPVFYLEFKNNSGGHLYQFLVQDIPLSDLSNFFFRIGKLTWDKRSVDNTVIQFDSLAVNAAIKLGFYDEIDPHYVPLKCEPGIDMKKIYGEWRSAGTEYNRETKSTYFKTVFTKDGVYEYEKIKRDTSSFKFRAKFRLDQKRNMVILNKNGSLKKMKILKLTADCLVFKYEDNDSEFVYNRLR